MIELLKTFRAIVDPSKFAHKRWVTEEEGELLYNLVKKYDINTFIESGTANGFSACYVAAALPNDGFVFTFDPIDRPKLWDYSYGVENLKSKIEYIQQEFNSLPNYMEWRSFEGKKQIVHPLAIFIDGDHGGSSVREDWNITRPYLRAKDIVIFHDLDMTGPRRVFGEAQQESPNSKSYIVNTKRITGILEIA